MIHIGLSADTAQLENYIRATAFRMMRSPELVEGMEEAHRDVIESNVASRLKNATVGRSYGDVSKNTDAINKVSGNISSGAYPVGGANKSITGWTGNVAYMDANDPISSAVPKRALRNNKVKLWRIFESGTKRKDYTISARNKSLLRYYSRHAGGFVFAKKVKHPGLEPKNYFYMNNSYIRGRQKLYDEDRRSIEVMRRAFNRYVSTYLV
ncbi:hypothetical protein M0R04_05765 [Candidatus Dojkabacteria bacterium]|jgi:hypothetical protein|nr:hypothetical protein [Candidatus Dojkabacteria bacterium]